MPKSLALRIGPPGLCCFNRRPRSFIFMSRNNAKAYLLVASEPNFPCVDAVPILYLVNLKARYSITIVCASRRETKSDLAPRMNCLYLSKVEKGEKEKEDESQNGKKKGQIPRHHINILWSSVSHRILIRYHTTISIK